MLISLDQWNIHNSNDEVISRQESEILALKKQIITLKSDLQIATSLETKQYINIPKNGLLSFLDLCIQMQDIKLPTSKEIVFAEFPIVWSNLYAGISVRIMRRLILTVYAVISKGQTKSWQPFISNSIRSTPF
jgi:hypothetical protein